MRLHIQFEICLVLLALWSATSVEIKKIIENRAPIAGAIKMTKFQLSISCPRKPQIFQFLRLRNLKEQKRFGNPQNSAIRCRSFFRAPRCAFPSREIVSGYSQDIRRLIYAVRQVSRSVRAKSQSGVRYGISYECILG